MANIFAVHDTRLNPFLFSSVGEEANGSLTVLSLLARLDKDPWEEAAAWARAPKEAVIRALAESIAQLPPNHLVLDDVQQTASRLVAMLPAPPAAKSVPAAMPASLASMPKATLVAFVYLSLFLMLNFWLAAAPKPVATAQPAVHVVATAPR